MENIYVKYSDVKERLLKAESEDEKFIEKLDNMDTPLSKENYAMLVKLILGDDYDSDKVSNWTLAKVLHRIRIDLYLDDDERITEELYDDVLNIIDHKLHQGVARFRQVGETSFIYEDMDSNKINYGVVKAPQFEVDEEFAYVPDDEEIEDEYDDEYDDEYNDEYDDGEIEELYERLEVSYEDVVKSIKLINENTGTQAISDFMDGLENYNISTEEFFDIYRECCALLLVGKAQDMFETEEEFFEYIKEIDSKDFAKFVAKVKKDFETLKNDKIKKLELLDESREASDTLSGDTSDSDETGTNEDNNEEEKEKLETERDFFEKWCGYLDTMHTTLNKYEFNKIERGEPKVKLKYKSSGVKNKFNFKSLEPKAFLDAMKNYGKYALMGAGVGITASVIIPSAVISGVGTIRLAYSAGKFVNKVISKGFLNGEPTKVDKFITSVKEKIKNIEITKKSIDEDTDEEITEKVKFKDTKFYKGIQTINEKLKNPKVQWFINGMAVGYKLGNWLDLDGKVRSLFETKQPTTTIVQNGTSNLQTEPTNPTVNDTTVPQETIKPISPKPTPEVNIPEAPTTETNDYSWLDVGKDGDKIDLTGMKQGYTDSYAARGAYTGQYEHLNKAVNLVTEYATEANGTFISELRLPDGSIFTGNIGELLETGVDPSQIAARIANQNGNYAWGNLEEVLETLSKVSTKSR